MQLQNRKIRALQRRKQYPQVVKLNLLQVLALQDKECL